MTPAAADRAVPSRFTPVALEWQLSSPLLCCPSKPSPSPAWTVMPAGVQLAAGKCWGELTVPPGTSFLLDDELDKLSKLLNFVRRQNGLAALEFLLCFDLPFL